MNKFYYYGAYFDRDYLDLENFIYYVYVLVDPRDSKPFYVGKGSGDRYKSHLSNSHNIRVRNIVNKLNREGLRPIVHFIEKDMNELQAYMQEVLSTLILYNENPDKLCNTSYPGPFGSKKPRLRGHTEESKELIRQHSKGRDIGEEGWRKLLAYHKNRPSSHLEHLQEASFQRTGLNEETVLEIRRSYLEVSKNIVTLSKEFKISKIKFCSIVYGEICKYIYPEKIFPYSTLRECGELRRRYSRSGEEKRIKILSRVKEIEQELIKNSII